MTALTAWIAGKNRGECGCLQSPFRNGDFPAESTSMSRNATDISELCERIARGDSAAHDQLITLVYVELQEIARKLLRDERPNHSLRTTDLAHAAYLKLAAGEGKAFQRNRAYFFAAVARAMRQILIDRARKWRPPLSGTPPIVVPGRGESQDGRLIALDEALNELAKHAPRPARVVELRYFGGMTVNSVAEVLEISPATVERDFRIARAFLRGKIVECMGK